LPGWWRMIEFERDLFVGLVVWDEARAPLFNPEIHVPPEVVIVGEDKQIVDWWLLVV